MIRKMVLVILILFMIYIGFFFMQNQITLYAEDSMKENNIDILSMAVLKNDIELVKEITGDDAININQKDSTGKYPLEMVLVMGNCEMAEILLEAGADSDVITTSAKTIHELVMSSDNEVLKQIFNMYK